ncbi:PREDICTED: swi5-dependent recombination DNA repair protein 1 homolog [Priapulus caudatus]|uniref:Swi5-dependent recombination DNA repair protein 1 homolog n=1 Tax=Priapulus caudatus TaxID=37621 RepID=A0ABM1EDX0_PRICU|nr:PREDICTED: swi5-dependent recombination DNA repair protein 1 homolog [Priapulus caudatus]
MCRTKSADVLAASPSLPQRRILKSATPTTLVSSGCSTLAVNSQNIHDCDQSTPKKTLFETNNIAVVPRSNEQINLKKQQASNTPGGRQPERLLNRFKRRSDSECNRRIIDSVKRIKLNDGDASFDGRDTPVDVATTGWTSESSLQEELVIKEDKLRKLQMVELYKSKNDLVRLEELINKWRGASQQILEALHGYTSEPRPTISQLLDHLQIPASVVMFNPEDQCFE